MWQAEGHSDEPIDLRHYEQVGGLAEAIARHANEAFDELSAEGRRVAAILFKCLTEKSADGRAYRRPALLGEICAVADADEQIVVAVIEAFRREGRCFLTPPAGVGLTAHSVIDISQESLIRQWQRLDQWLEEEAESARTYLRLAETATYYARGASDLLRGIALQVMLEWRRWVLPNRAWAARYHSDFDKAVEFLEQSEAAWEKEQRRELRRRRTFVAYLACTSVLFLILAIYGLQQRAEALRQKVEAEAQRDRAIQSKQEKRRLMEEILRLNSAFETTIKEQR